MSFQAYLDNVQAQTGKSLDDFRALAADKGFFADGRIAPSVRATQVTDWLKADFALGRGHAMAVYAMLSGKNA